MEIEKKIVKYDEIEEYKIFGWNVESKTPEGSIVLSRNNDDPKIKKYLNFELQYDLIKVKIKQMEMPEYPKDDGKICSTGVCVLLMLLCFPVGIFLALYKPEKTRYENDMKNYSKQLQSYEAELKEIRTKVQYGL